MDERGIRIPVGRAVLHGDVTMPDGARGVVLFAHGSGSSRFSPRNRLVARLLSDAGLGTVLIDLLTPEEERVDAYTGELRFDIGFVASRLGDVMGWLRLANVVRKGQRLGLFGSSTGAAAALVAAAHPGSEVAAVVSRGGRPDLAGDALGQVLAATLLIVGSDDVEVLRLNEQAFTQLTCEKQLELVQGASHLFEEPGTLEQAAQLAREWFLAYLAGEHVSLPTEYHPVFH